MSETRRSYYNDLGVASDATQTEITKAYRALVLTCHPDKFLDDPQKAEEFKLLSEAYKALSDPILRQQHDESLKWVEEEIIEVSGANVHANGDNLSLVVSSTYNLESLIETSGITEFQLYCDARRDSALAKSIFANQRLFTYLNKDNAFTYSRILAELHESVALMVVDKNFAFTHKFDCFELASLFPSVRKQVLEAENKFTMITTKQEELLRALDTGNKPAEIKKEPITITITDPELLALANLSAAEMMALAKESLDVAKLLAANPSLKLPREYEDMPSIIYVASYHEEIALQLLSNKEYQYELSTRVGTGSARKKSILYLADKFLSVKTELVNNASLIYIFSLPISDISALLADDLSPLTNEKQKNRIACFRKLHMGDFERLSDDDILKLLDAASLNSTELKELIIEHKKLVDIVYAHWKYFFLVNNHWDGWRDIGEKYEDIALMIVKEKISQITSPDLLLYTLSKKWLSIFTHIMRTPTLAAMLTGEQLHNLEIKYGLVANRLIMAADLHEKLHAYGIYENAKKREGGFNTQKRSVPVVKKSDPSEPFLQRGLSIKDGLNEDPYYSDYLSKSEESKKKIRLMAEYFYHAAKLGNETAYQELKRLADITNDYSFTLLAMEAICIAGKAELVTAAIEESKTKINVRNLVDFLTFVQARLQLDENQNHLTNVGNMYFDIVVSATENPVISNDPVINDAYRCLAILFEVHDPAIAMQFVSQIPFALRNQTDLMNMANWALANAKKQQELTEASGSQQSALFRLQRYHVALPYYLRACKADEIMKSAVDSMFNEIENLDLGISNPDLIETQKGEMFLGIGWEAIAETNTFINQAKLAWEKAKEFKNPIAIYIVNNFDRMQEDESLFTSLKLISQKNLTAALPLLDSVRSLPTTFSAVRSQFINLLSESDITEEMISARAARLEKLQELAKREAKRKELHTAINEVINEKLIKLAETLKGSAYHYRSQGKDNEAVNCGIRTDALNDLATTLLADAEKYFSHDVSSDEELIDEAVFRDAMIKTINDKFTTVNGDLKDNMTFFTWVAYNLVRALRAIFPTSTKVQGWMNSFNNELTVIPVEADREDIRVAISGSLN